MTLLILSSSFFGLARVTGVGRRLVTLAIFEASRLKKRQAALLSLFPPCWTDRGSIPLGATWAFRPVCCTLQKMLFHDHITKQKTRKEKER